MTAMQGAQVFYRWHACLFLQVKFAFLSGESRLTPQGLTPASF